MGEGCVTIEFAGEAITLMPERAAWWEARRTVIVADLHLGKSETMRVAGLPVPDIDLDEQFERLERVVEQTGAARVVVAGDLIHAPAGLTPGLSARVAGRLEALRRRDVSIVLVRGNHDRRIEGVEDAWGLVEIHEIAGGRGDSHCARAQERAGGGRSVHCGAPSPGTRRRRDCGRGGEGAGVRDDGAGG
jgi:metallophosphoesterase superfamily enzyme